MATSAVSAARRDMVRERITTFPPLPSVTLPVRGRPRGSEGDLVGALVPSIAWASAGVAMSSRVPRGSADPWRSRSARPPGPLDSPRSPDHVGASLEGGTPVRPRAVLFTIVPTSTSSAVALTVSGPIMRRWRVLGAVGWGLGSAKSGRSDDGGVSSSGLQLLQLDVVSSACLLRRMSDFMPGVKRGRRASVLRGHVEHQNRAHLAGRSRGGKCVPSGEPPFCTPVAA